MSPATSDPLIARLTEALPAGAPFVIQHVSAPPANCAALFSAPPNEEPEPTECESHFLCVSIEHQEALLHALAVEVLIYTTATLTTIFVSKADSTGYLPLANLPKTPSPIKSIISAFLEYLVETKRRKDARLVLSLFARAQDQYLFPGSIENQDKHVLDDRGLIRWWCKIFDSILKKYNSTSPASSTPSNTDPLARGYLVVPGCDAHETRAYFPKPYNAERWKPTDPLRLLGKSLTLPERCLIPRFPDDPKARFALDLDDELPENGPQPMNSPEKNPHPGKWRSVRSLEQFWELMAFRQECAAGRLVGFLWGVFESSELRDRPDEAQLDDTETTETADINPNGLTTSIALPTPEASQLPPSSPSKPAPANPLPPVPPLPSVPPLSPQTSSQLKAPDSPTPVATTDQSPQERPTTPTGPQRQPTPTPTETGSIRLSPPAYTRVIDSLMALDYADRDAAKVSAVKWTEAVVEATSGEEGSGEGAGTMGFGVRVVGTRDGVEAEKDKNGAEGKGEKDGEGNGLVRKRPVVEESAEGVNTLSAGLVRKKKKV